MYDKEYLEAGNVKKIETVEEALALVLIEASCCDSCRNCPVRMYEENKGVGCSDVVHRAKGILGENCIDDEYLGYGDHDGAVALYNALTALSKKKPEKPPEPEKPKEGCKGTCVTCLNAQMHTSGILFCKSFGNFVHQDGYCYRFESDKIEEVEEVAPQSKVEPKALESDVGDWVHLPF